MLFSIGRTAIGRLAATASATTFRRVVASGALAQKKLGISPLGDGVLVRGFAAATTRTKAAPKAKAKAATAKKTTAAKKKATATKKKATGTKKATVKGARKKTAARKTRKTAKSTRGRAKGRAKATKAKPRRRKALTDEQKAVLERKTLKEAALTSEPKIAAESGWSQFVTEQTKGKPETATDLRAKMGELSAAFKQLPDSETQRLQAIVEQNKAANRAAYKKWVNSFTPAQIHDANKARKRLKRKYDIPKGFAKLIHDDRQPKRPASSFVLFTKARWASGDYANKPITESAKLIGQEWKNLSAEDRRVYEDPAKKDLDRYEKEVKSVLNLSVKRADTAS
ncbi:hypothetical protein GGS23DRAFT_593585 [Durotheca rogersii]|uniref:uncharacterized protein n=1 Tax=Durotheca rogersii TaxID=419775 RepID=UPI00221FF077|nr:uncharacterized protein GGS23DRAFT_593585 [Durotheca rogersii]KAI5866852.1 hypothetical protein GGS23DRAFT_593585 [Durotheca rogersii]